MSDATKPVRHALNCLCEPCCTARREEAAGRGLVFGRKPKPGTAKAITGAYLFPKKRPTKADVERAMVRLSAKAVG